MRYRKLTADGDYSFGGGLKNFWIDSPFGVAQAAMTRLRLWAGEWFLDLAEGTPYQGGVLGKHTKESADLIIRERILNTEGVIEILQYESFFNPETRVFRVEAEINTVYGTATIQEVL